MSGNNNEQVNGTIYPISHSGLSASSTTVSSAAGGGLLGAWSGFKKGGAIGAVIVGAAAGAWASKKVDLGISNQRIKEIADEMPNNSSALLLQITKVERQDLLQAFIRESGGTVAEIEFSDGEEANMFELTTEYQSKRVI